MSPSICAALGRREGVDGQPRLSFRRRAAAVIGIAGAIGAFGGFLIQVAFRQASLSTVEAMGKATKPLQAALVKAAAAHDKAGVLAAKAQLATTKAHIAAAHATWSVPALWVFLGAYVVFAGMTWFFYLRRSVAVDRVPSLAYAGV